MFPDGCKKVSAEDLRDGRYSITPLMAQEILDHGWKNRKLTEARAQRIANDIAAGKFRSNGESIVFDEKSRLLDGQHRLRAVLLANRPVELYCIFGIPSKYFPTFDQGKMRTGSDIASAMGFQNSSCVGAIVHLALLEEDGVWKSGLTQPVSRDRLTRYLETHRVELEGAAHQTVKHRKGIEKLTPMGRVAFIVFRQGTEHPSEMSDFLDKLSTGIGLKKGDAILLYRNRMLELIGNRNRLSGPEHFALLIKTWNAHLSHTPLGVLKWNKETEAFPRLQPEK